MNKRIEELFQQAMHVEEPEGLFPREVFDEQKFAELIIRECASLTLDYRNHDHYIGWTDYRDEIKCHFGIE